MAGLVGADGLTNREAHDYFLALEKRVGMSMQELVITVKHAHFCVILRVCDWRNYIDQDEWAKMSIGARIDAFLTAKAKADAEEWD